MALSELKLLSWWQLLYRSYWFVPSVMSVLALALAFGMVQVDEWLVQAGGETFTILPRINAEGGRIILSTIAGSSITVAGVVFSITIVVLSTAANQFGPGLLPNFMNQRPTQIVLGGFVATFIYCLIVLSHIRGGKEALVPHYSLSLGILLGIISFLFIIYFIHHVALFIQVPRILSDVGNDLHFALSGIFPEQGKGGNGEKEPDMPDDFERNSVLVRSAESNYVQAINYNLLLELASRHDLIITTEAVPGDYLLRGRPMLNIYPASSVDEQLVDKLHSSYLLGVERTSTQDPLFAVDQIIEIAVRALSPGINDPYTALACINKLGEAFVHMAERDEPLRFWRDSDDRIRLVRACNSYASVLDRAFNHLRQYSADHPAICANLMLLLADLARLDPPENYRNTLSKHAERLLESAEKASYASADHQNLKRLYRDFRSVTQDSRNAG